MSIEVMARPLSGNPELISTVEPGSQLVFFSYAVLPPTAIVVKCPVDDLDSARVYHIPYDQLNTANSFTAATVIEDIETWEPTLLGMTTDEDEFVALALRRTIAVLSSDDDAAFGPLHL